MFHDRVLGVMEPGYGQWCDPMLRWIMVSDPLDSVLAGESR
ncbi:hypothetical protein [Acetobacter oryzifermentans]|nr:hypothetical protein [Acetobacter oryzifermentans]